VNELYLIEMVKSNRTSGVIPVRQRLRRDVIQRHMVKVAADKMESLMTDDRVRHTKHGGSIRSETTNAKLL
jgi:hypothetical protein